MNVTVCVSLSKKALTPLKTVPAFYKECFITEKPTTHSLFPRRNAILRLSNCLKEFDFLQECTCAIFVLNFPDFCIDSKEKSVKLSVKNAQDSSNTNAICEGKLGNIEMQLRSRATIYAKMNFFTNVLTREEPCAWDLRSGQFLLI